MRVLIVDDEPHIRQMMRLTLETAGYDVGEAAGGEEGLKPFGGRSRTLRAPRSEDAGHRRTGDAEASQEARAEACVVMVTAYASIELAVEAMKLGATDFLRKPMTPETLRGAVAAAVASLPRTAIKRAAVPGDRQRPQIESLTLNGFRIVRAPGPTDPTSAEHVFRVMHFPHGVESTVTVLIDPEAVARVTRLTRRELRPGGAFWREQAHRLLSSVLWSEGTPPENGRLTLRDVSRDDIDVAAAWTAD